MERFEISRPVYDEMVAHCLSAYPLEGCGLLAGPPGSALASRCYSIENSAASARIYALEPMGYLRADRNAEDRGFTVNAVFHSHTHTPAYPSPTDVAQAPDPGWHYVLVSFEDAASPSVRSFRIIDDAVTEEEIVLTD